MSAGHADCFCCYRNKMQKMTDSLDEYHERWSKIEHLCGFSVCHTFTVSAGVIHSPGHHPTRKISRSVPPAPGPTSGGVNPPGPTSGGVNQTSGKQEPLTNTEVAAKPFQALSRDRSGSMSRETSEKRSIKLGRVSITTTTDSSSKEELGGSPSFSTLTRRKPF